MGRHHAIKDGWKICARCGFNLRVSDYYPRPGGVASYCKDCKREMQQERLAEKRGKPDPTIWQRLFPRLNRDQGTGCWEWPGAQRDGYGLIEHQGQTRTVHLVVLELLGFVVPPELDADHMCRNRCCSNPGHLRFVTPYVNAVENNSSPFAINAAKTHCKRCNTPYTPGNFVYWRCTGPKGTPMKTRACLTCYPNAANSKRFVEAA